MIFTPEVECYANGLRETLRAIGWTEWSETHVRVPHLIRHEVELFTADHPEGPLVRFRHPEKDCGCCDDELG